MLPTTMHGRVLSAALPALLMLSLSAAGCGDDGEGSTSGATATTSTITASAGSQGGSTTASSASTGAATDTHGHGGSSGSSGSSGATTTGGDPTSSGDPTDGGTSTGGDPGDGFLRVDPDHPAWLQVDGQGPFFICGPGDPEDFLHRGALLPDGTRDGDQAALIAKLAPTGANSVYVQAIRSHGGDGD
ncbi:MAG: hypothetical protein KC420_22075, partial [Myxococcales bacterium]|nr:hypothetical protein [Myxococcales bacterium]